MLYYLIVNFLRKKNLIPKICLAAIKAHKMEENKFKQCSCLKRVELVESQCELILKILKKNHKILSPRMENLIQ